MTGDGPVLIVTHADGTTTAGWLDTRTLTLRCASTPLRQLWKRIVNNGVRVRLPEALPLALAELRKAGFEIHQGNGELVA